MQFRLRPELHLVEWLVFSDLTFTLCRRSVLNVRRSSMCPLFRVIALSARHELTLVVHIYKTNRAVHGG
jgi:hypothetical protein